MYTQSKILVIGSDESETRRAGNALTSERYEVIVARDWKRGLRELYGERPQALILFSESNNEFNSISWGEIELVRSLCDIPVIIVADQATRGSLQAALDLGVAGFLVRPFDWRTLSDRLATALERPGRSVSFPQPDFRHDNLCIEWRRFEVRVDGELVRLSPIEFKLLALLVEREGEVVTHGEILARVWGANYDLSDRRNVKLYIWYLRKKLERDPSRPRWIITRNGLGYIFSANGDSSRREAEPERDRTPVLSARAS